MPAPDEYAKLIEARQLNDAKMIELAQLMWAELRKRGLTDEQIKAELRKAKRRKRRKRSA